MSIFGTQPLGRVAEVFGSIAGDIEGLDTRLTSIADLLDENKDALLTNADLLRALGTQLATVADDLRTGIVQDSLADVQLILTVLFVLLVAWTAVPAAGALWIGWWLRRELAADGHGLAARRLAQRRSWRNADLAARYPPIPCTPPPGGVDDEAR